MSWRERLFNASFRSVGFWVEEHDAEGGRRAHRHDYVGRESYDFEDLGAQPRMFRVRAVINGPDYDRDAAALEEALNRSGRGLLIHPYLGQWPAVVHRYRRHENARDGGMAVFEIDFERASAAPVPQPRRDHRTSADNAKGELYDATSAEFADGWSVTGWPGLVRANAIEALSDVHAVMRRLDVFSGPARDVGFFQDSITQLITSGADLVTAPADLAATTRGAMDAIRRAAGNARGALYAYRSLLDIGIPDVPRPTGRVVDQANRNRRQIERLIRAQAIGWAVRTALDVPWEHEGEALEAREEILAAIDSHGDDLTAEEFDALSQARAVLVEAVPPEDQALPRIVTYTPPASTDVLSLAYRLHDDLARAEEIIARNGLRNPAMIVGGQALEVLADGDT